MESLDSNESFLFEVMVDPKSKGGGDSVTGGGTTRGTNPTRGGTDL